MVKEPPSVAHEIVRERVLALLDQRWEHLVTTVTAGPGFGKSIAVGQALRANRARPRGIEAWVSCRWGCEEPGRLADAVRRAFEPPGPPADGPAGPGGAGGGRGSPLAQLQAVFAEVAPVDATLVLDDVELLATAPACVDLLDALLRQAPWNLHLVLAGRALPPLPLARLRAAGEVVEVTEVDLRFDPAEVAALARTVGVPDPPHDLGGWPALVRLAVAAPRQAVGDFLWEEVIRGLAVADRRALLAACVLGSAAPADIAEVCGTGFDPEDFCTRVPLVHQADGAVVAHDLWSRFVPTLSSEDDVADISQRSLAVVEARGDPLVTGALALRLGDHAALRRSAVALVRATLTSLPVDVAGRWLAAVGDESAEMELLGCALEHALAASAPPGPRIDEVAERFRAADDLYGEAVTLAFAAVVADANSDVARLVELAGRAAALAATHPDPVLRLLVTGVRSTAAAMGGDIAGALSGLEQPVADLAPHERSEAVDRLRWRLLLLAGRAAEAAALADGMGPTAAELAAVARWLDGDPSALLAADAELGAGRYAGLGERERFDHASYVAVLAAGAGDRDAVDTAVEVLEATSLAEAGAGFAPRLAVARANQLVLRHDEEGAVRMLRDLLDREDDPLTDAFLRRHPAVPYICSAELRDRWDAAEPTLGPAQVRAVAVARLYLAARIGLPDLPDLDPEQVAAVCTVLPLPWSVELAARAAARRLAWGTALAEDLADRLGDPVRAELDRLGGVEDPELHAGVEQIRRRLPAPPAVPLEVRVLGSLEVCRDGAPVEAPELRRGRVRELLSILVVERTVTRDRVLDLLWPDVDPDKARANLRVTLTHLQRLLEPDRPGGRPPYFVRADGEHIRLAAVAGLQVDLWEVEHHLAQAQAAQRAGDTALRLQHLEAVVERWRGRPLPDLDRVAGLGGMAGHLVARLGDACLTLGELELVRGGLDAASRCATTALAADPYLERAHRLAIAAHLQSSDRTATQRAVADLRAMLADLEVTPEEPTQMLLRQAASR